MFSSTPAATGAGPAFPLLAQRWFERLLRSDLRGANRPPIDEPLRAELYSADQMAGAASSTCPTRRAAKCG